MTNQPVEQTVNATHDPQIYNDGSSRCFVLPDECCADSNSNSISNAKSGGFQRDETARRLDLTPRRRVSDETAFSSLGFAVSVSVRFLESHHTYDPTRGAAAGGGAVRGVAEPAAAEYAAAELGHADPRSSRIDILHDRILHGVADKLVLHSKRRLLP